ncbi:LppU family putative lipoprotein [Nocardia donostiensis]|uniref:LppU protein n=1 Tax=Nocardia donostiensis TaxID=1538463 RepID=A0A1W0BB21_9NOCA|nr:hypothetical protein B0T46_08915 [Nocardia donostiensis]OQS14195.1 hypothetical protein B0T36_16085 [Nocardia donostiensis]OQS19551.1 hypothetical protein B0T44_14240 [Nocardia donostiensis]
MSGRWTSSRVGIGLAAVAAAAVFSLTGCSSSIEGTAQPQLDSGAGTSETNDSDSGSTTTSTSPLSTDEGGDIDFEAEIGDCVTLGGTTNDATIEQASCGSQASNYKVIGKAEKSYECVSDSDNYYAETINGLEQGALCLDIDWVVGTCMDMGGDDPERIDCGATATEGIKVLSIEQNADDVNACGAGSSGYVYDERRFVVCVEEL